MLTYGPARINSIFALFRMPLRRPWPVAFGVGLLHAVGPAAVRGGASQGIRAEAQVLPPFAVCWERAACAPAGLWD